MNKSIKMEVLGDRAAGREKDARGCRGSHRRQFRA